SADSSGSVSSTRLASPWLNRSRRTRSPTLTASSTSADIRRGVETATSTPHDSLNSHSFFGLLTRATTRGTPYSVLASSETTRLTLSSPVAAMTTLQRCSAASSSDVISQASASSHSACGTRSTEIAVGVLSMSRTSWPFSSSSPAMERPTAPAPAMATLISDRPPRRALGERRLDPVDLVGAHHHMHQVALLQHRLRAGQYGLAEPGQEGH